MLQLSLKQIDVHIINVGTVVWKPLRDVTKMILQSSNTLHSESILYI